MSEARCVRSCSVHTEQDSLLGSRGVVRRPVHLDEEASELVLFLKWHSWSGDEGTRTPDLLRAKQALFQLSYAPKHVRGPLPGTISVAAFA